MCHHTTHYSPQVWVGHAVEKHRVAPARHEAVRPDVVCPVTLLKFRVGVPPLHLLLTCKTAPDPRGRK